MRFSQASLEVKLFSLGFLLPHEVDNLQLVDSALATLIEDCRRHLPRHALHIVYESIHHPILQCSTKEAGVSTTLRAVRITLDDGKRISALLNPRRVGCVQLLTIRGRPNMSGRVNIGRSLVDRVGRTGVPVRLVESWAALPPPSALMWLFSGDNQATNFIHHYPRASFVSSSTFYFDDGFTGRAVFTLAGGRSRRGNPNPVRSFVKKVIAWYRNRTEATRTPSDLLVIHDKPGGEVFNEGWARELGEPEQSELLMGEWWREAAEGDTPLHNYYRLLEGCEWAVWRVRNRRVGDDRHLRVMHRIRGGDARVMMAVHLQVVNDAGGVEC